MHVGTMTVRGDDQQRRARAALGALLAVALLAGPLGSAASDGIEQLVGVIVRDTPAAGDAPERFVERVGGEVGYRYEVLNGFSASIPADQVGRLASVPGVIAVSPDARVRLHGKGGNGGGGSGGGETSSTGYSLTTVAEDVRATHYWGQGLMGQGVDVALIDTGVSPVEGLSGTGKLLNGPDISFESQISELRYLDTYGHGTHMAAIIAGKDAGASYNTAKGQWTKNAFIGIAPDARLVSLKVGNAQGATDVSQVLAAIDWVVQNRNRNGLNIRVLNLSFGTESNQSYVLDPLSYAAEVAWRRGIFVVAAVGNNGKASGQLSDPAYNPRLMAVGANDTLGTPSLNDDIIPTWSSRGDGTRNPDLVAPGKSINSLRVPGSHIDQEYASAANGRYFRGSGTSQAAAVVSGAAALVIQQRPSITPDQLKKLLRDTAAPLAAADLRAQGRGMLDMRAALTAPTPSVSSSAQSFTQATGLGTIEGARGGVHVQMDGVILQGEKDIFGNSLSTNIWAPLSWDGATWSSGMWNGATWSGATWSGSNWAGATWSGATWSGATWSGATWSGATWNGATWSGEAWSGATWSGATWSGATWSGATWSGASWS